MYKKMYYQLFNAIIDALELLEQGRLQEAGDLLKRAQQDAEETYLSEEEI